MPVAFDRRLSTVWWMHASLCFFVAMPSSLSLLSAGPGHFGGRGSTTKAQRHLHRNCYRLSMACAAGHFGGGGSTTKAQRHLYRNCYRLGRACTAGHFWGRKICNQSPRHLHRNCNSRTQISWRQSGQAALAWCASACGVHSVVLDSIQICWPSDWDPRLSQRGTSS